MGNSSCFGTHMSEITLTDSLKHLHCLLTLKTFFSSVSIKECFVVPRVYFWTDDHGRKLKCSAPLYFDYAMLYIQDLLTDEDVFPTKAGKETSLRPPTRFCRWPPGPSRHLSMSFAGSVFPTGFIFLVQKVFLLFFRTLAHIYWSHYKEMLVLGLHPHLNTLFTHLTLFCRQHALLDPEDTEPLQDLITALGQ